MSDSTRAASAARARPPASPGRAGTLLPPGSEADPRVPLADLDGSRVYRRRIRLRADRRAGLASAELEDDFHHFAAYIEHDGARVTRIRGEATRVPWTTCPGAVSALTVLEGSALTRDLSLLSRRVELGAQCTHLFDCATLSIAIAASGLDGRVYDAEVPEAHDGLMKVRLVRDAEALIEWDLQDFVVRSPGVLEGCLLVGPAFSKRVRAISDPDESEAVLVLRRAVLISMARAFDMDRVEDPQAFARAIGARCHTFSPEQGASARRVVGANRDFTHRPQALLPNE